MNALTQFFHTHPAAFSIMTAAATHFSHLAYTRIVGTYAWLKAEGGLRAVWATILGPKKDLTILPAEPKPLETVKPEIKP